MRLMKIGGVLVASLFALALSASVLAQDTSSQGTPTILDAVNHVQTTLDALAGTVGSAVNTTLANLVTTVNGLVTTANTINSTVNTINSTVAPGNTAFTPAVVAFSPDSFICTATNVVSAARTIKVDLVNGNTGAIIATNGGLVTQPGLSTAASNSPSAVGVRAFCEVTVTDGLKTDVRAVLALYADPAESDKLVIAAQ